MLMIAKTTYLPTLLKFSAPVRFARASSASAGAKMRRHKMPPERNQAPLVIRERTSVTVAASDASPNIVGNGMRMSYGVGDKPVGVCLNESRSVSSTAHAIAAAIFAMTRISRYPEWLLRNSATFGLSRNDRRL